MNIDPKIGQTRLDHGTAWQRGSAAVVFVGAALRLLQVLGNPSLWADEIRVALNVIERSVSELLTVGLDYGQVAPTGWLLLTKAAVLAFGEGELALRLVPFAASVLGLVLFWRLAEDLLEPAGAFLATAAFATNPLLISLASTVKQYSVDVLATVIILIVFRSLSARTLSQRRRMVLAAGAGALGFFSIPSAMVAAGALTALFYPIYRGRVTESVQDGVAKAALSPLVLWGVVAGVAAVWTRAMVSPDILDYMGNFWGARGAFVPSLTSYPTWVLDQWSLLFDGFFMSPYMGQPGAIGSSVPTLAKAAMLIVALPLAILALFRKGGVSWVLLMLLPVLLAFGLSALEIYPMAPRTGVFMQPLLLLSVSAAVTFVARRTRVYGSLHVAGALIPAAILIDRPPTYVVQDVRGIFQELSIRRSAGEPVFVHHWSAPDIRYYGPRFDIGEPLVIGSEDIRDDLRALHRLPRAPSVWILFTSAENHGVYLCYLDEIGEETDHLELVGAFPDSPVSLHQYRLDGPEERASPEAVGFDAGWHADPSDALPFSCRPHVSNARTIE